jgi:hypothetical protein
MHLHMHTLFLSLFETLDTIIHGILACIYVHTHTSHPDYNTSRVYTHTYKPTISRQQTSPSEMVRDRSTCPSVYHTTMYNHMSYLSSLMRLSRKSYKNPNIHKSALLTLSVTTSDGLTRSLSHQSNKSIRLGSWQKM